jgi:probable F420-dependent oxidoreductase
MKLGMVFPQTEAAGDSDRARRFVTAAEEMGYDYLLLYDHPVGGVHEGREPKLQGPYTEKDSFHDPFVFFAFAAGLTTKLEFASGVLILPQRQTALVAQQAADVDLLSKERFRLGVGVGWNWVEYEALGQDFRTRGRRIDEQIGLLRKLWAEPLVSFEGEFDRIDRAGINPRPKRQIPIFVGGFIEAAFVRGAKLGDGYIFAGRQEAVMESLARVRHHLREFGRDEASFGLEWSIHDRPLEAAADSVKAWREAGGTHACVPSMRMGFGDDIEAHIGFYEELKRRVDAG